MDLRSRKSSEVAQVAEKSRLGMRFVISNLSTLSDYKSDLALNIIVTSRKYFMGVGLSGWFQMYKNKY